MRKHRHSDLTATGVSGDRAYAAVDAVSDVVLSLATAPRLLLVVAQRYEEVDGSAT